MKSLLVGSMWLIASTLFVASQSQKTKDTLVIAKYGDTPYQVVSSGGSVGQWTTILVIPTSDSSLSQMGLTLSSPAFSSMGDVTQLIVYAGGAEKETVSGTAHMRSGSQTDWTVTFNPPHQMEKFVMSFVSVAPILANVGPSSAGVSGHKVGIKFNSARPTDTIATTTAGKKMDVIGESSGSEAILYRNAPYSYQDRYVQPTTDGFQLLSGQVFYASGDTSISIGKITIGRDSSRVVKNVQIFAYKDSARTQPLTEYDVDGRIIPTKVGFIDGDEAEIIPRANSNVIIPIQVEVNKPVYLDIHGTVEGLTSGQSVSVVPLGDPTADIDHFGTFIDVFEGEHNNFIWSPNTIGVPTFETPDWLNGNKVIYLPQAVLYSGGKG